jgi:L-cystine uptake protein TcyP (sodium:dicarboxylate symporter family)
MEPLTEKELAFITYWENHRLKEKKFLNQLLVGLPLGILFGMPILINFFLGWYKRAEMVANTQLNPVILITAIVLIIVFIAIFSRRHKWEMKEQYYLELKARERASAGSSPS